MFQQFKPCAFVSDFSFKMLLLLDMKNCVSEDDDYDQCVSDLSDDDSYTDCDSYAESERCSTIVNPTMKYIFTSMAPEGDNVTTRDTVKQVLVLTNVSSMQSLTAGSEKDDAPRIPSRTNISSASTSALRKHHKPNHTRHNVSWHSRQKPAGESSNFLTNRIKLSRLDLTLNQKLFTEMSAERPSSFQNLQAVSRRRFPSRPDLRSANTPALQYGVMKRTDYQSATWIDKPTNQPAENPFCSPFESMVRSSHAVNLTENRLPHDPSVTSLISQARIVLILLHAYQTELS